MTEYDFNVELRIQSVLRNEDRDVKINLGELTTAVAGENFEVAENVTIPAGETSVIVPVKVYKKGLADIEGGLVVELVIGTSDDFIPGVYGKGKEGALALVLSIDYLMENLDKQYRIELYNPDLSENDKGYYNIRRNTIYRVFATLKGPGNMEYDIVVDEWEDTEVAIPW